jgi:transcriptional regulator with XRE-family HTH domain
MSEYLPGNLQERLKELREINGYSQDSLADTIGVYRTTYGRIESGSTKTINSDILIKLSELYNVSTDYILGISDVPEKTYYDIGELGLSVEAAKNLLTKNACPAVVDYLLRNDKFILATRELNTYFSGVATWAFKTSNSLYDFSYDLITEHINGGRLPRDKDVNALQKQLKAKKVPTDSFQLTRIQAQFATAIREIKHQVAEEVKEYTTQNLTSDVINTVREEINSHGDLLEYSYEDRKRFVIDAVKVAVKKDSDYSEEFSERIDQGIEVIMSEIIDIWKRSLPQKKEKTTETTNCAG